ncbi:unnamed protein product, partial [Plutella xylostella]
MYCVKLVRWLSRHKKKLNTSLQKRYSKIRLTQCIEFLQWECHVFYFHLRVTIGMVGRVNRGVCLDGVDHDGLRAARGGRRGLGMGLGGGLARARGRRALNNMAAPISMTAPLSAITVGSRMATSSRGPSSRSLISWIRLSGRV